MRNIPTNPSANIVLVADKRLQYKTMLYGFDLYEIARDEVNFTEDMIHFAPAHPERLMLADLRTSASQELYLPKGDPLRAAFAKVHKQHMPPAEVCQQMNDPCRPACYDEDIEFLIVDAPKRFAIRVRRNATHAMVKSARPDTVTAERAMYVHEPRGERWLYCATALSGAAGEKADCQPDRPVAADGTAGRPGPFVRKVK